jgi:hypothetical protein
MEIAIKTTARSNLWLPSFRDKRVDNHAPNANGPHRVPHAHILADREPAARAAE